MAAIVPRGLGGVDLPEEAFQRGALRPLLLTFRDLSMTPRIAFPVVLRFPSPRTVL